MSRATRPLQTDVLEDIGPELGVPADDDIAPVLDGRAVSLVYDLSNYGTENGILVRKPQPVEVQSSTTGPTRTLQAALSDVRQGTDQTSALNAAGTNVELLSPESDAIQEFIVALRVRITVTGSATERCLGTVGITVNSFGSYGVVAGQRYDFQNEAIVDQRRYFNFNNLTPLPFANRFLSIGFNHQNELAPSDGGVIAQGKAISVTYE